MEHAYFKDRISAFHDRELKHEEAQMMAEHLEKCAECRQLLEQLEKFDRMVEKHSGLAGDEYWEESARKIEAAISPQAVQAEIVPVKSRWTGMGWKLAAVAASLAVLTFVALHEGEISESIKAPVEADTPREVTVAPHKVEAVTDEEGGEADEVVGMSEETETSPVVRQEPMTTTAAEVEAPTAVADKLQPENEVGYLSDSARAEDGISKLAPEQLVRADTAVKRLIRDKVKTVPVDSVFPSTQVLQSVPSISKLKDAGRSVSDTKETLMDSAPVIKVEDKSADLLSRLEKWRDRRDSLENIVTEKKQVTVADKAKKKAAASITSDKDRLREAVDSVSKELIRQDPELQLLEAHYEVAMLTKDRREYDRSVRFLKSYLKKEDSPYKLQAAWYLQLLEETE